MPRFPAMLKMASLPRQRVGGLWARFGIACAHALVVAFAIALFAILRQIDAFEQFYQFSRTHEDWNIDEGVLFLFVLTLVVVAFLFIRNDRLKGEIRRRMQSERLLDAALSNMRHGVVMYDSRQRLLACNQRYAEMYGFPPELMRPGTRLRDILEYRARTSVPANANPEEYVAQTERHIRNNPSWSAVRELSDGRWISVTAEPMPDGGWVSTHVDVTDRKRSEERMVHLAHFDSLTGVANRSLLRKQLEEATASDGGEGHRVALLMLDLDRFKDINDTHGHPMGDALLEAAAQRLRGCIKQGDTIARLGGDEFAILMRDVGALDVASSVAERVIAALSLPFELNSLRISVGASVGIALTTGKATSADQLLKHADLALYRAKNDGRGTYRFFEPEMDRQLQARSSLVSDLRRALSLQEFELLYQPILDIRGNFVRSFESLLRWRHPVRGLISPAEFIPLAEETGLIVPIGEWVLRQACSDAVRWPSNINVAVNVSGIQFKSTSLLKAVAGALAVSGLSARRLDIEITESVLLRDSTATLAILHQLHAYGVRICMDDFGTGYSSLSYLHSFPFDKIKVDRSFTIGLPDKPDAVAIMRAISGLARSMRITTTAEGVETAEQFSSLREMGFDEIQGYFISRPRPVHELGELIHRSTVATSFDDGRASAAQAR